MAEVVDSEFAMLLANLYAIRARRGMDYDKYCRVLDQTIELLKKQKEEIDDLKLDIQAWRDQTGD